MKKLDGLVLSAVELFVFIRDIVIVAGLWSDSLNYLTASSKTGSLTGYNYSFHFQSRQSSIPPNFPDLLSLIFIIKGELFQISERASLVTLPRDTGNSMHGYTVPSLRMQHTLFAAVQHLLPLYRIVPIMRILSALFKLLNTSSLSEGGKTSREHLPALT